MAVREDERTSRRALKPFDGVGDHVENCQSLAGLTGIFTIDNDNGAHSYTFDYELP